MKTTGNLIWQEQGDFLADILGKGTAGGGKPVLAHAVNLFLPRSEHGSDVPTDKDLARDSPSPTPESLPCEQVRMIHTMRAAADFAMKSCGQQPYFLGIANSQDLPLVPPDFERISMEHERTGIPDLLQAPTVAHLPRLFDILRAIQNSRSEATHIVFTNPDIHLQPWFYVVASTFLQAGFDSLIINRRTVQKDISPSSRCLPVELLMAESGMTHPGLDCFVFPKEWLVRMVPTHAVVGRGAVMRSLLFNLVAIAEKLLVLSHAQLTYHYGDDRPWMQENAQGARQFNKKQAADLWLRLVDNEVSRRKLVGLGSLFSKYVPELPPDVLQRFFD